MLKSRAFQLLKSSYRDCRLFATSVPCNPLRKKFLVNVENTQSHIQSSSHLLRSVRSITTASTRFNKVTTDSEKERLSDSARADPLQLIRKKSEEAETTPKDPKPAETGGQEKAEESFWTKWFIGANAWKTGLISIGMLIIGSGVYFVVNFGAEERDTNGNIIKDEFSDNYSSVGAYMRRAWRNMHVQTQLIRDPSRDKLLPDPLSEPYFQPPYTLVVEMKDVLVHPEWTYQTGWRFKKRPAVEFFLQQVGPPLFELVIFTSEQGFTAWPILDALDPNGFIVYRLFRDATRYVDGHHVKDLSCLNRDLSKVILVDCDQNAGQLQPRNTFNIPRWNGDDSDRALVELAAYLRMIALSNVTDVRDVLEHYKQFDNPLDEFKKRQARLLEEEAQRAELEKTKKPTFRSITSSFR